jgi:catechol 2,3-dioxygenase-like lactoylglutathione lyase family enzyme
MIEHFSLRVRDSARSKGFYERALAPLGYKLSRRYGDAFGFLQGGRHDFWITRGRVGTPGHVAFHAPDKRSVDAFYQAALRAGGGDNGAPGIRDDYGYAAYVLDPDGHNVEAVVWLEELAHPDAAPGPKPRKRGAAAKKGKAGGKPRAKARRRTTH